MRSDWQLYKRLLTYMLPFMGFLLLSVFGNVLFAVSQVLAADAMQLVVDSFGVSSSLAETGKGQGVLSSFMTHVIQPRLQGEYSVVFWVPFLIVLVSILRGVGSFVGSYFIDKVGFNTIHSLRKEIFEHFLDLPVSFFDANSNAHLVSRVTYNVQQVSQAVTNALMITIREGLTVIGMLSYMLYLNWRLSLVFLLVVPFIALTVSYVSKRFRRLSQRIQNSMGDVTHVTSETVSGIRAIKIFSGENYERQRFLTASDYNRDQSIKMSFTNSLSSPFMQVLVSIALAILIAYGLNPEVSQTISSGSFVAFLTAAGLIAKPLRQLGDVVNIIQRGLAAADDIFTQLDVDAEVDDGQFSVTRAQGDIKIQQLSFAYKGSDSNSDSHTEKKSSLSTSNNKKSEDRVLKDINLHINSGEVLALVGRSGSGKSTLVNLLPRFYTHAEGKILLDDVSINDFELKNLRSQFSLVSQNITLFNDTIYNNIAYGSLNNSAPEAVHEAMRIAHINEFIEGMPLGENTIVGDQGVLLSGGQRQRIAIARAILKDAPVLILDEATSALDNDSESLIQAALETVMKDRTTIVIAHRLSTIEKATQILVMEQGEVIERGTHQELLDKQGAYHSLYHSQFKLDQ